MKIEENQSIDKHHHDSFTNNNGLSSYIARNNPVLSEGASTFTTLINLL